MSPTEPHPRDEPASRFIGWLVADRNNPALLMVAGLLGFGFALYVLGWDGIAGTSEYWRTTHNDSVQGIAALHYYVSEPWSWSFLDVRNYGVPTGTTLVVADAIPLLAVPTKALSGVLPDGFHYFGLWMAACFTLQAISMVALLGVLRWRNYLAAFVGSVMALLQMTLLARFFHVSLMAQFVVTLTVLLGVRLVRGAHSGRDLPLMLGLLGVVLLIHPYLYAMALVLGIAFVLQAGAAGTLSWRTAGVWLGSAALLTGMLLALTGLAGLGGYNTAGFGYYSANVLSLFLPEVDATGGQYEGVAYLGLGVIVLIAAAVATGRKLLLRGLKTYWIPTLVVVLMAVYAVSTSVWVGESLNLEVPIVAPLDWLAARFRSSGRFIWPLVYVLVAGSMVVAYRRFDARTAVVLLLAVTTVQLLDLRLVVTDLREILQGAEEQYLDEAWGEVIGHFDLVSTVPYQCVVGMEETAPASRELQRIAAGSAVSITAAAVARRDADCDHPTPSGPIAAGELRVVWDSIDDTYGVLAGHCVDFGLGTACAESGPSSEVLSALEADG